MGSPGGSGVVDSTPAARALQRSEPLPMRAGQAPASTPSDDVKKKPPSDDVKKKRWTEAESRRGAWARESAQRAAQARAFSGEGHSEE